MVTVTSSTARPIDSQLKVVSGSEMVYAMSTALP